MKIFLNTHIALPRVSFAGYIILALLSLASISALNAQQQPIFKALVVRGKPEVQSAGKSSTWEKISVGSIFDANDKLRLAKDSYLSITYIANGRTFELKNAGSYKINDLAKEAAALSSGAASNIADYVLREVSSSSSGDYKQNMSMTASVERSIDGGSSKKNVVLNMGDDKPVKLYKGSYALLIGVSNYTDGWPSLPGVRKDIDVVKKALEEHGFQCIVIADPRHDQLDDAFRDFINRYCMDVENRVIFYFAGHGHTLRQSYGEEMGYIIPADAPNPNRNQQGFIAKAMAMQQLEVYAKQIQSKHALFLFDACFSGSIFSLSRAIPENISYKTAKPVRQFITSGGADETVPDKSVFREQLIGALNGEADVNKDGFVTGTELGEFLQDRVVNYSRNSQHPQYGKIRNPNLDKGDFVFSIRVTVGMKTDANGQQQPVVKDISVEPIPNNAPATVVANSRPMAIQLGVRGAVAYTLMDYDINVPFWDSDPAGKMMTGIGFTLGISADIPFTESLGMIGNVNFVDKQGGKVGLYYDLDEGDYFEYSMQYLSADLLLRYSFGNFWLAAGPSVGLFQSGGYVVHITDPATRSATDEKGILKDRTEFSLAARVGLGYTIHVSDSWTLTPDILVSIPFSPHLLRYDIDGDIYESQSTIWNMQVGLAIRYKL